MTAAAETFIDIIRSPARPTVWKYDSALTATTARGRTRIESEPDLCRAVRKLYRLADVHLVKHGGLRIEHIYSHFQHAGNEAADTAANKGVHETCTRGRYHPTYQHHEKNTYLLYDATRPPNPTMNLNEEWGILRQAITDTIKEVIPPPPKRKRREYKPSKETLRLESAIRNTHTNIRTRF